MKNIFLILLIVVACSPGNRQEVAGSLTPDQFNKQISAASVLVDVRTPEEYASGHIANAINIDFRSPDFAQRIDSLDKSRTYLLYCASGVRSGKAADVMRTKGFASVANLEGGTDAWTGEGLPLE